MTRVNRALLTEAYGGHLRSAHAERLEIAAHGCRAALSKREVVLPRSALIAMALDGDAGTGVVAKVARMTGEDGAGTRLELTAIEVEVEDRRDRIA